MPSYDDEEEGKYGGGEGKYSEGKYDEGDEKGAEEGDEDEWVLPGMGQAAEDTLLTRVATVRHTTPSSGAGRMPTHLHVHPPAPAFP